MARPATRQSSVASDGINMAVAAKQVDTPTSKRSRNRPSRYASQSVSPSRRRTTRSQSRELETVALKSHAKQIGVADDPPAPRHGARGRIDKMAKGKELAVVQEESPSASARHSIVRSADNTIVEELPEETVNISGTTFLPTDSDHESGELDALMMAEVLPDLQRAATSVLEFLLPAAQTRPDLLNLTRKLQDSKSPQSRRLDRLRTRFLEEMTYFGNQTYIDVGGVSRALPSVKPRSMPPGSASKRWHPDGILYKANCARLALEVLTSREAMEHVLYDLEGKFPAPFMSGLIFQGANRGTPPCGKSVMHQLTSDVALDIRTQFLKMKLEAQKLDDFDPEGVLQDVFFNEPLDDDESDVIELRGFNLAQLQDNNGDLPRDMRKQVTARIRHIRQYFTGTQPPVDYEGLDSAFPWSDFVVEVGRWLYRRDDEINKELKAQPSIEDIRDLLEEEISRRSSFGAPATHVSLHQQETSPDVTERSSVFRGSQPAPRQNVEHPTGDHSSPPHGSQPQQLRKELLPAPEFDLKRLRGPVAQLYALRHINRRESLNRATSDAPEPSDTSDFAGFISQHAAKASATSVPGRNVLTGISLRPQSRDGPSMSTSPDPRRTLRGQPAPQTEQVTVADSQWEITLNDDDDWGFQHASPSARAASRDVRRPTSSHNDTTTNQSRSREPILDIPSSKQILAAAMQHKASSGKDKGGPSFIDRQANARRVSPINLDSATPVAGPSNLGKRKRTDDGSEEDEFSQDQRAVDVEHKRAQKPIISPSKRARFFDYDLSDDGAERQLQSTLDETIRSASEATSSPQRPRASQERQTQVESQANHHSHIRNVMDRFSALSGQPKPQKPHQTSEPNSTSEPKSVKTRPAYGDSSRARRRWSNEENDRLIYLIENYGVSWATLKRKDDVMEDGPKLEDRDQVQLKDRARNIKIDYIRNGYKLPKNFDKVGLKKADIERLRAIGREVS